jgi:tetratricopeptide (TPR) repeat protein
MKNLLIPVLAIATLTASAQKLPAPSPLGKVEQLVGLTNISVSYSRPSMKGRKIFGELVPHDKVWRTGANLNTIVEVSGPVMIEGQELAPGQYSLFTIPGPDVWEVIFNKNIELQGEGDRKDEEDVLRVKAKAVKAETMETFTILFDNVKDDRAEMQLRWENTLVRIGLHADATEMSMANIREALADPNADFRAFHSSARFLLDRNMMPQEALKYAQKSVELDRKFWNVHTLALAHAANGQYNDAIAAAEESMKMAQDVEYDAYVKLNRDKIAEWQKPAPVGKVTNAPKQ